MDQVRRPARRLGVAVAVGALLLAAAPPGQAASGLLVAGLQAEAQTAPLGLDVERPRLSWRLDADRRGVLQTAYRVRVASSRERALAGDGDVWDSGRVASGDVHSDYAGAELAPRTRYWWTVEVWDERGERSGRSAPAWFETAFTEPGQWTASWISGGPAPEGCSEQRQCSPAPLLREEFEVDGPVESARLYASGLGYGTYLLNGRRVGDEVLSPGFTEYTERALYVTHDVTDLLERGRNVIGAELGRGPFGSVGSNFAGYAAAPWHADPQLRLELHVRYRDGRQAAVRSGPGWTTTDGPRRFDDYMLGESYDARRALALQGWSTPGYDDRDWSPAPAAPGPQGALESQVEEPVRPQETLPFEEVVQTPRGWRFDLGENVTGAAVLRTDLPTGTTITLHYGEKLLDDGSVDTTGGSFDGSTMQLDTYTAGPGPDVWRPEFTFKGFSHVEVSGLPARPDPSMLTAEVWHTDMPETGTFVSSHPLVDRILAASRRAMRGNTLSIPMDTPIYEKTGYTADGQLVAGALSYLYDTRRFYDKWLTDVRQSVAPNGDMGISAPLPSDPPEGVRPPVGINHTTPGWDAALMVVPEVLKQFHGDERHGVRALPEMDRVRQYYETRMRGDVLPGTCTVAFSQVCNDGLGDWTAPTGSSYGAAVDSTAWYAYMLREIAEVARDAGDEPTAASAQARAEQVTAALQRTFFDPATSAYRDHLNPEPGEVGRQTNGVFFNGEPLRPPPPDVPQVGLPGYSQHQNALPLGLGLVPEEQRQAVGDTLAADVRLRGHHLSTGIVGTRFLFEALASTGHVDEAFAVLTQTTYPSYGYWLDTLGYTSLGEFWEGNQRSLNHQMYGSVVQWLFEGLAGVRPTAPGFAEVQVRPEVPTAGLDHVTASYDSVRGRVASGWRRTADGLVLDVTIPAGATAQVHVPAAVGAGVTETGSGRVLPVAQAPGVQEVARDGERLRVSVGSGTYRFVVGSGAALDEARLPASAPAPVTGLTAVRREE